MKFVKPVYTACILALLLCLNLFGQSDKADTEKQFSVSALQQDMVVLRKHYENNHSNLYLYTPKPVMDRWFDSLFTGLHPMTEREFYNHVTPLLSVIKDGHSLILPGAKSTNYHLEHSKYFPFQTYCDNGHLYTIANFSNDNTIANGTEILAINGESAANIWNYLMARQVRDGYNEHYPRWILNHYFRSYYNISYGYAESYTITTKTPDSLIIEKVVAGVTQKQIVEKKNQLGTTQSSRLEKGIALRVKDSTAILVIRTWDTKELSRNYHQHFKKEIASIFKTLQQNNIHQLIIDVRDNQGGTSSNGAYLLGYLLQQPYQYITGLYRVKAHTANGQQLKAVHSGLLKIYQPRKNSFNGKLYILTNGGSFSNSAIFCSRLQTYGKGRFIGEETGGNATVLTGVFGIGNKTTLPNTGLVCDKANYRMVIGNLAQNMGRGVYPVSVYTPSIADVLQGKDGALEFVQYLMREFE